MVVEDNTLMALRPRIHSLKHIGQPIPHDVLWEAATASRTHDVQVHFYWAGRRIKVG